ncbi:MAG TPA: prolyl oligopeptidase family serine peptidase [Candidatus Dormibacteraeota bacterium]|nr:prolyl oligopeptidase family serine peptidase [Candidatus Dormibacteraeota bacterium]
MRRRGTGDGDDLRAAELTAAPYGSWRSSITADLIVAGTITPSSLWFDGEDLYWSEQRPAEGGRVVIVRRSAEGSISDVTPPGFNARTRVHEYGGGAFAVDAGTVWFSNFDDQRLYRQDAGGAPRPLTEAVDRRYADFVVDRSRGFLYSVREDHADQGRQAVNVIVALGLDGESESVVIEGNDFYSNPRLAPDSRHLCWLTWNHPNLPWDGTELWVGELAVDGSVGNPRMVAGGGAVSVFQPEWSPGGDLHYVSDENGWWNLYRLEEEGPRNLTETSAEFGLPQWVFRQSTYAFAGDGRIACSWIENGSGGFGVLEHGLLTSIENGYTSFGYVVARAGDAYFCAGSPKLPMAVVRQPLDGSPPEVLRSSLQVAVGPDWLSEPESIEFPTEDGRTAFAFYYPPLNPDFEPADEAPPLLVHCHGGPTAAATSLLNLQMQYWTSRGWAVVDVNYGGSTGYGTEYRRRLNGKWGVMDVDDCVNAARHLVAQGLADPRRVAIAGGSAGGYTTLCALTTRDYFRAGANYFGLSDLLPFVKDTHKFESRYLDSLIGPWPQARDLYVERSPLTHVEAFDCPLIVFQGLEDKIVPPNQSELIVDALRRKGLPVAYLAFEGEQHGFRKAENIKRSLEGEMYFYSQVFDFDLADPVTPVEIENF